MFFHHQTHHQSILQKKGRAFSPLGATMRPAQRLSGRQASKIAFVLPTRPPQLCCLGVAHSAEGHRGSVPLSKKSRLEKFEKSTLKTKQTRFFRVGFSIFDEKSRIPTRKSRIRKVGFSLLIIK